MVLKYRLLFPLSFWSRTWFSMRNSKFPSILESSWNYLELWNSSGYGLFLAKFDKMGIKSIQRNDFEHYWKHLMIFQTWTPDYLDIQESWNPLDLAGFCWLQCIGYFSHRVLQCKIPKFYYSWNLPGALKFFWKRAIYRQIWHRGFQLNLWVLGSFKER